MALNEVDPAANRSTANGATTVFPYTFEIASKNDIEVLVDLTVKTVDTDYTVDGIGNSGGGNVTFLTAPADQTVVTRIRKQPAVQASVYTANQGFPHAQVMNDFDKLWMAVQQMREQLHRAMLLPKSSALVDQGMDVPTVGSFARGKVGGGIDWATVTSAGSITIPVPINEGGTGATTAAAARAALGTDTNNATIDAKGDLLAGTADNVMARRSVGTNGQVLSADSSQSTGLIWVNVNQPRNPIINGNMEIWQRGTSFVSPGLSVYTADRWQINKFGGGAVTVNRSTNVPSLASAGLLFNYSLEVDVTTADNSVDANDLYRIDHFVEGYNWRHFSNRQLTISFWVLSSKAGIHSFCLGSGSYYYTTEYTISSANTWEHKTITIPSTATALGASYTTGNGCQLMWTLMAGSTYSSGVTLNAWTAGLLPTSTNQVNVLDNTANFFRITGVKMELGSIATPIQYVPFEEELQRCQRYFAKSFEYATAPATAAGQTAEWHMIAGKAGVANNYAHGPYLNLRASPSSITFYNPVSANNTARDITGAADLTINYADASERGFGFNVLGAAGTAVGNEIVVHWTVTAEL